MKKRTRNESYRHWGHTSRVVVYSTRRSWACTQAAGGACRGVAQRPGPSCCSSLTHSRAICGTLLAASVVLPEGVGALVVDVDFGLDGDRRAAASAARADHAAAALARAAPPVSVAPAVTPAGRKRKQCCWGTATSATDAISPAPSLEVPQLATICPAANQIWLRQERLTSRAPRRCRRTTRTRAAVGRPQARSAAQ